METGKKTERVIAIVSMRQGRHFAPHAEHKLLAS